MEKRSKPSFLAASTNGAAHSVVATFMTFSVMNRLVFCGGKIYSRRPCPIRGKMNWSFFIIELVNAGLYIVYVPEISISYALKLVAHAQKDRTVSFKLEK